MPPQQNAEFRADARSSARNETPRKQAIPALTGIRFVAAVYVFLFHYGAAALAKAGVPQPIITFLHNGTFGVSVFFVLSGFILSHAHPGRFTAPGQYLDFLGARFARIYPVYLFALIVAVPVPAGTLNLRTGAAVLCMVQSWPDAFSDLGKDWIFQAWTLSVEFFFYLSFPVLINVFRRRNTATLLGLCVLDAAFLVYGGIATIASYTDPAGVIDNPAWLLNLPVPLTRSTEFAFGMLLQILIKRLPVPERGYGAIWLVLVAAGISSLLAMTANAQALGVADVLVGILITLIYVSDNIVTRWLGSPTLYLLGSASYAFYLLQGPIHSYLAIFMPGYGRLIAFPLAVAAAILVWRYIEEPARRIILRFRPAKGARLAPVPPEQT
jgi:peptidoglycan/LPS O-acetylase OafA/YrhL